MIEARAGNSHVFGKVKSTFEFSPCNTAMQVLDFGLWFCSLTPGYYESIPLLSEREVVFAQPGNCHIDPIIILTGLDDIVRWPVIGRGNSAGKLETVQDSVETYARTKQG